MTGKGIAEVEAARAMIPPGTPINIAFLGNETHAQRISAARVIRACGFEPVPIISSRRLFSQDDLDGLVKAHLAQSAPQRFIFVGGDPARPAGPFRDSLTLLDSGILDRHPIRQVGIVAYPEGHPKIDSKELWRCLKWKLAFLRDAGCEVEITTQFGFDTGAVVDWLVRLRDEGIEAPVRIGIPGPADTGRLLRYARQFGVVTSARIMRRYGLALTSLLQSEVADRYWMDLGAGLAGKNLGKVHFHLYPFGGIAEGVEWMNERLAEM